MFTQKRWVAHTYMSSRVNVSAILKQIQNSGEKISFESYVVKAAAKAFHKVFPDQASNVSHFVTNSGLRFHERAHEFNLRALNSASLHESVVNFTPSNPASGVTVTHIDTSTESLPISNNQSMINLHYTSPSAEVTPTESAVFDIETLDYQDLSYNVDLTVAQTAKISISFDI